MFLDIPITVIAIVLGSPVERARPVDILLAKDGHLPKD